MGNRKIGIIPLRRIDIEFVGSSEIGNRDASCPLAVENILHDVIRCRESIGIHQNFVCLGDRYAVVRLEKPIVVSFYIPLLF